MRKPRLKSKKNPDTPFCALESPNVNPVLTTIFSYCFHKAAFRLRELMNKELAQFDIIGPQVGVMRLLQVTGPMSQNDIGQGLSIDKATVVKFIDHLEKKKLVIRRPDKVDRRVKYVELTAKGAALLVTTTRLREKIETEYLSVLEPSEKAALLKAIPKLLKPQS